jgi:hypothetical protein
MNDECKKIGKKWRRIRRLGVTPLGKSKATKYCKLMEAGKVKNRDNIIR